MMQQTKSPRGNRPEKQTRAQVRAQRARLKRRQRIRRIAWRSALSVLTVIAVVLVAALCAGFVAFRGPSQTVGALLTVSMLETSALKFVPRSYYSDAEMAAIAARNQVADTDSETDTSMIVISGPGEEKPAETSVAAENLVLSEDGIDIYRVKGATYNGFMMVVHDPSRVGVGV